MLKVEDIYGLNFTSFVELLQRSAEEQGLMFQDGEFRNVVPLVIAEKLAAEFIKGSIKMMRELSFDF
jgi:hypothetical protein